VTPTLSTTSIASHHQDRQRQRQANVDSAPPTPNPILHSPSPSIPFSSFLSSGGLIDSNHQTSSNMTVQPMPSSSSSSLPLSSPALSGYPSAVSLTSSSNSNASGQLTSCGSNLPPIPMKTKPYGDFTFYFSWVSFFFSIVYCLPFVVLVFSFFLLFSV
jgi:hypothetical protein